MLSNSLVVQWLGLGAFTAGAWVQSLIGELTFYKPHGMAKKRKKKEKRKTCTTSEHHMGEPQSKIPWERQTGHQVQKTLRFVKTKWIPCHYWEPRCFPLSTLIGITCYKRKACCSKIKTDAPWDENKTKTTPPPPPTKGHSVLLKFSTEMNPRAISLKLLSLSWK